MDWWSLHAWFWPYVPQRKQLDLHCKFTKLQWLVYQMRCQNNFLEQFENLIWSIPSILQFHDFKTPMLSWRKHKYVYVLKKQICICLEETVFAWAYYVSLFCVSVVNSRCRKFMSDAWREPTQIDFCIIIHYICGMFLVQDLLQQKILLTLLADNPEGWTVFNTWCLPTLINFSTDWAFFPQSKKTSPFRCLDKAWIAAFVKSSQPFLLWEFAWCARTVRAAFNRRTPWKLHCKCSLW